MDLIAKFSKFLYNNFRIKLTDCEQANNAHLPFDLYILSLG